VRTFRTVTQDLLALRDWLQQEGCTHVAMESTGVYWKPVYAILEGACELIVGNARHIKNVPGRKTDLKDSEWIADLARHGLIAKSFVPPTPIRVLRDLVRIRRPPQLGHTARALQENGTRRSAWQSSQRKRAKPRAQTPQPKNWRNSRSTNVGTSPALSAAARNVARCARTMRWSTVCSAARGRYAWIDGRGAQCVSSRAATASGRIGVASRGGRGHAIRTRTRSDQRDAVGSTGHDGPGAHAPSRSAVTPVVSRTDDGSPS